MIPSISSLYRRSRYFRAVSAGDEDSSERHERERYTVAALGLCLRRDEAFRNHFFGKIVGQGEAPFVVAEIALEREDIDLIAVLRIGPGRRVVAVEAKLGAGLADHQNPAKPDFWRPKTDGAPGGYGTALKALYPDIPMHYVVLGHPEPIVPPPESERPGWGFRQIAWGDLLPGFPDAGLAGDLADLLVRFGEPSFAMRQTDRLIVSGDLRDAVSAQLILQHVCRYFGVTAKLQKAASGINEDGGWFLGVEWAQRSEKGDKSGNLRRLTSLVRPAPDAQACWFGYESVEGKPRLGVWLYCGDEAASGEIVRGLSAPLKPLAETEGDCVFFRRPEADPTPDREWFLFVFQELGLQKSL